MTTVRGRTIENEAIVLDDVEYLDCQLINCNLQYGGGLLKLTNTSTHGCMWGFYGHAERTIQLLRHLQILTGEPEGWVALPTLPDAQA